MFRTKFKEQVVAEFLPPSRERKTQKVVVLCDGMPSIPHKQPLSEFLAAKGFWVIYPGYGGAWESDGHFLEESPHEDILDIIDDLPMEMEEIAFGRRFRRTKSSSSGEASGRGSNSCIPRLTGKPSNRKLSGSGLEDSGPLRKGGNL